jgi:membrane associated rhomboid family serine protease
VFCYRHPDRETGVSCQRCGRYICPQCQVPNAVGYLCPEDGRVPVATKLKNSNTPSLTIALIAINALVYLGQLASQNVLTYLIEYQPSLTQYMPWTLLSAGFAHASIIHIGLNMYSLFLFGSVLEPLLGKLRFATLYLLSILGGSVAVLFLAPNTAVLGASGGIFGLMGAYFVILRSLGQRSGQMTGLIALNLIMGFLPGTNISWQAHVGGLVIGGLVAYVYSITRSSNDLAKQRGYLLAITAGLVVAVFLGVSLLSRGV